ncbi:hypothetical protein L596_020525 [Steinernema carpocapsae]|uniref:CCHC-type domain-containing protein n=1 Tax=Steinernema carpocapsae TaxID=34508 RepID=A0A4V6A0X3_STECR|nr:hypothetical protein L596_020525 [Steinernema carpocapsae]
MGPGQFELSVTLDFLSCRFEPPTTQRSFVPRPQTAPRPFNNQPFVNTGKDKNCVYCKGSGHDAKDCPAVTDRKARETILKTTMPELHGVGTWHA